MKILVGREDGQLSRLSIKPGKDKKPEDFIEVKVPASVSRGQIEIDINDDTGQMVITNKKNVMFVNGRECDKKAVSPTDFIELGYEHWPLPLRQIYDTYAPKFYDLTPLRAVWNEYDNSVKEFKLKNARLNAYRMGVPILSTIAIGLGFIISSDDKDTQKMLNVVRGVFYGIVIVANIIFFVISLNRSKKNIFEEEERRQRFQRRYVCPACGHFMGNSPYDIISQNKQCSWCRAKYGRR